jgi:hypothetical protein
MKTLNEVKAFFESDLRPDLQDLESLRLQHIKKLRNLRFVLTGLLCPVGLILISEDLFSVIMFQFAYTCGIVSLWGILHSRIYQSYKPPEFKNRVMARIVEFIDPAMIYNPEKYVPEKEYWTSKIFLTKPGVYYGDDLVTGSLGKTSFTFSELETKYETGFHSGKWYTVFHGLFFFADFNKSFTGMTFVIPDPLVRRYGKVLGNYFRSRDKSHGDLVKLEDPRFEKDFVVHGSDQIEARYILSTALMRRICDYGEKTKKDTYLSFINNRVYVAIKYNENIFEANLYKSFIDFGIIQEYYEDLAHAIGLVEDLNLNTIIWG